MLHWINATPLDQRRAFTAAWIAGQDSVAELARRFRISRKTAYKFIDRFKLLGDADLHDLPRATRNPRATDPEIAKMIAAGAVLARAPLPSFLQAPLHTKRVRLLNAFPEVGAGRRSADIVS